MPVAASKSTNHIFPLPHIPQFLISWLQMLLKVKKKIAQKFYDKGNKCSKSSNKEEVGFLNAGVYNYDYFILLFAGKSQSFEQHWHVAISSLVRKMGDDMSEQFFVRNIHLHEESRVKNLICKAI